MATDQLRAGGRGFRLMFITIEVYNFSRNKLHLLIWMFYANNKKDVKGQRANYLKINVTSSSAPWVISGKDKRGALSEASRAFKVSLHLKCNFSVKYKTH